MLPRQLRECGERAGASDGEGLQPPLLAAAVREETGTRVATAPLVDDPQESAARLQLQVFHLYSEYALND